MTIERKPEASFLTLYLKMFTRPGESFSIILNHPKKLRFGFLSFLVPALGYTLFYIMAWHAGGAPTTFKPWLALPIENYFHYGIFLSLPGYFLSWVTAASSVYLLSKALGRNGTYDDTLIVLGFGIGVATWSSMLHDLTDAFLGFIGVIDIREYERLLNEPTFWRYLLFSLYLIYFVWFIALFYKGMIHAQKMKKGPALLLALTGLVVFQSVLLLFIR